MGFSRCNQAPMRSKSVYNVQVLLVGNVSLFGLSGRIAPIKTIDFADIGLGDNLMAWSGLHALLSHDFRPTAPGCVLYVPTDLAKLASRLFSRFQIRVEGVRPFSERFRKSPVFTPSPPEKAWDWVKTYVGPDWWMNSFEALDAQRSIPFSVRAPRFSDRVRLGLSERILYGRRGWRTAAPEYFGYRLWRPLAARMGVLPVAFLGLIKRSLPALRKELAQYIGQDSVGGEAAPPIAIFPAGKSFQAFPGETCKRIRELLPAGQTTFYLQADDPWIDDYRSAGLNVRGLASIEDVLWIIKTAPRLLTTDSFSSHAAQFLRDDFVLALTRDFQENIVHPGAHPSIVANHPPCAPCGYIARADSRVCSAKQTTCLAFDAKYSRDLAKAVLSLSPSGNVGFP
jgi:hypothetical protein